VTHFVLLEVQSEAEEIFDNLYYISGTVPFLPYPRKVATLDTTVQIQFNTPKTWETKHKHPWCQAWSSAIYSLSTTSSHLARLIGWPWAPNQHDEEEGVSGEERPRRGQSMELEFACLRGHHDRSKYNNGTRFCLKSFSRIWMKCGKYNWVNSSEVSCLTDVF
jgi:hypothetical protein